MTELLNAGKAIIELAFPTINDMELIRQYGLFNWVFIFLIKTAVAAFIVWFIFSKIIITLSIRGKK